MACQELTQEERECLVEVIKFKERVKELEADYADLREIQTTDYNHAVRNAERIKELEDLLAELYTKVSYEKAGEWLIEDKDLQKKVKQVLNNKIIRFDKEYDILNNT